MNEITKSILSLIISPIIGTDLAAIQKAFDREKLKTAGKLNISNNIDAVSQKLEESKETIELALLEVKKQKVLFEQMKKEAEISQQIVLMNQEQTNAVNELLEKTLNKQEKKNFLPTFMWNLFFCVLGSVLGLILGMLCL